MKQSRTVTVAGIFSAVLLSTSAAFAGASGLFSAARAGPAGTLQSIRHVVPATTKPTSTRPRAKVATKRINPTRINPTPATTRRNPTPTTHARHHHDGSDDPIGSDD